jgi:hypothetical protein
MKSSPLLLLLAFGWVDAAKIESRKVRGQKNEGELLRAEFVAEMPGHRDLKMKMKITEKKTKEKEAKNKKNKEKKKKVRLQRGLKTEDEAT